MIAFTLVILIMAIAACFVFIKLITKPLSALAAAAEQIDERNMELRVKPAGQDEVVHGVGCPDLTGDSDTCAP